MSLFGFSIGIMLANFHVCCIVLVLSAMFVRYVSPRGSMCFRCLVFNLSDPIEFLGVFCLFYGLLDLRLKKC